MFVEREPYIIFKFLAKIIGIFIPLTKARKIIRNKIRFKEMAEYSDKIYEKRYNLFGFIPFYKFRKIENTTYIKRLVYIFNLNVFSIKREL